jgi:hypothetical protein
LKHTQLRSLKNTFESIIKLANLVKSLSYFEKSERELEKIAFGNTDFAERQNLVKSTI